MRSPLPFVLLLLALTSCSSPPKPPTVDESQRRPANSAGAVELQVCQSDLQNTRILAKESTRAAEAASAAAARASSRQAIAAFAAPVLEARNTVYTILFAFGSTDVALPEADARRLIDDARNAPLILLRGRTDGTTETLGESRIARERTTAVYAYLVHAGVTPSRIRATYQPVGDHAADNSVAIGRALNRRVEIEIYRAAPQLVALSGAAPL